MEKQVYFGCFENYQQMLAEWGTDLKQPVPTELEVLFASYGQKAYEGDAVVLFQHGGLLYEVNGSHCSCFGLDAFSYSGETSSQWAPEPTSWAALRTRKLRDDQHEPEAIAAFEQLVEEHT